jgi:hypothetical protein
MSGIEEGWQRLTESNGTAPSLLGGEWGQHGFAVDGSAASYSLNPLRRTWSAALCATLSTAQSTGSLAVGDCPAYDLAIRTMVSLPTGSSITIGSRSLASTAVRTLPILTGSTSFTLSNLSSGGAIAYALHDGSSTNASSLAAGQSVTLFLGSASTATARSLDLTPSAGFVSSTGSVQIATASGELAIGKGYTTIEAMGYSGNARRGFRLTIRTNDSQNASSTCPYFAGAGTSCTLESWIGATSSRGIATQP